MPTIQFQKQIVDYIWEINPRLKHTYLLVNQGQLRVRSPKIPPHELNQLLRKREDWILKKLKATALAPEVIAQTNKLAFLGQWYDFELQLAKFSQFKFVENTLVFLHPQPNLPATQLDDYLNQFYRLQAKSWMGQKLEFWADEMSLYPQVVRYKKLKSRWGSCSAKGAINLNIKSMVLPEACIDSILIHELAHLKHLNHSQAFWQLVSQYAPDYRERNLEIKTFAQNLRTALWS